jgi:hypothetical protein
MKNVFTIMISSVAAIAVVAALMLGRSTAARSPARSSGPGTGPASEALLTAWRCPITNAFFTNPLICKQHCSGVTCQPVSQ